MYGRFFLHRMDSIISSSCGRNNLSGFARTAYTRSLNRDKEPVPGMVGFYVEYNRAFVGSHRSR
jgi:hypothetical protein